MHFISPVRVAMILTIMLGMTPIAARAQTNERMAIDLATARVDYENAMESVRRDVLTAIRKKISIASHEAEPDQVKIKQAGEEQDLFKADGKIPDVPEAAQINISYARAAAKMNKAYLLALAGYTSAGNNGLRDDVRADQESFESHWDLLPWQERMTKPGTVDGPKALVSPTAPLKILLALGREKTEKGSTGEEQAIGEYRFEIRGKRTGSACSITIAFPLEDGREFSMPIPVGDRGEIHVMASVMKNHVAADLGLAGPIDLNKVAGTFCQAITVSTNGLVEIDSVRVKRMVIGKLPVMKQPVVAPVAADQPQAPAVKADVEPTTLTETDKKLIHVAKLKMQANPKMFFYICPSNAHGQSVLRATTSAHTVVPSGLRGVKNVDTVPAVKDIDLNNFGAPSNDGMDYLARLCQEHNVLASKS